MKKDDLNNISESIKNVFSLTLVITRSCNLNCAYCYEYNKDEGKMDINIAKQVVEKYLTTGEYEEININLFGGEPFMEFEFIKELCEWTWSRKWPKKYLFFADTNGTLITNEVKEWTTKNKKLICASLSLDGTRETHNMNRSNSFDMIDLDFFLKNWPEQPIKMTITDKNLSNLANDFIFIHQKGFRIGGSNFAEGIIIKDFERNLAIISDQFLKLIDYYLTHTNIELAQLFRFHLFLCENQKVDREKRCGVGGKGMIVVDINGDTYPCPYLSSLQMSKKQLEEIKKIDFQNQDLFFNEECYNNCYIYPICHGCYGDNYTITGNFAKRSYQKCEIQKLKALALANYHARKILQNKEQTTISQSEIQTINAIQKINLLFGSNINGVVINP